MGGFINGVAVFHARTAIGADGDQLSDGRLVVAVTDFCKAYDGVETTEWEAAFWRTDIRWRAVEARKESNPSRGCSATDEMLT